MISSCSRAALAAASLLCLSFAAAAEEEVLLRKPLDFRVCAPTIASMLQSMGAGREQVRIEIDTGAILSVKLVATEANLIFRCGKADGFIEVVRTTPGEKLAAAE